MKKMRLSKRRGTKIKEMKGKEEWKNIRKMENKTTYHWSEVVMKFKCRQGGWNSNWQNVKCTIGDKYGHVDDIVTQMNCEW
jgi:hypothetical protein